MERFKIWLVIILVYTVTSLILEGLRRTRVEQDYTSQSKIFRELIDNRLTTLKIYPRDIVEEEEEVLCKEKIRWLYFSKKILVPGNRSLDEYMKSISKAIQEVGGEIIDLRRDERSLTLDIGMERLPFYSLTLVKTPSIGIIIDDFGPKKGANDTFLRMKLPLTFSILPNEPASSLIRNKAKTAGFEIMLHLPMEPHGYPKRNPGEGAIMSSMNEEEVREKTRNSIKSLPGIVGVNNHMGSKITEDERIISIILKELKREGLFFVDSGTSESSIAYKVAQRLGVKSAKNRVFLDNKKDVEYIKGRMRLLVDIALKEGGAIGLGHVAEETAEAIKDSLPLLEEKGVRLVYTSQLVK